MAKLNKLTFIVSVLLTVLYSAVCRADDICLDMHVIQSEPLGYLDESGKLVGIHVEVLQELERYSGICMTKHLMPIARIWRSIEQGNHDGGLVLKSASRAHLVEYAALIKDIDTIVIPRKGLKIESYERLHKLSIGKTRGTPLSNSFDKDNTLNLVELTSYGQVVEMLQKGRIEAIAGGAAPLYYHLSKIDDIEDKMEIGNKFVLGSREQWLQLSKKSSELNQIPRLQKAADLMVKNGDYDRIMTKYYGRIAQFVASRE